MAREDLRQGIWHRLQPAEPAGTLLRQAIKDTEVAGHHIPRKAQVAINMYASMRLADWWPEPDRFTAGADFGGGVHKCLGQSSPI